MSKYKKQIIIYVSEQQINQRVQAIMIDICIES